MISFWTRLYVIIGIILGLVFYYLIRKGIKGFEEIKRKDTIFSNTLYATVEAFGPEGRILFEQHPQFVLLYMVFVFAIVWLPIILYLIFNIIMGIAIGIYDAIKAKVRKDS